MKANLIFSNNKIFHTRHSFSYVWLSFIVIGFTLICLIIIYIASAYWHSNLLIENLKQNNIFQLRQEVTAQLLLPTQANILAAQDAPQLWQGAGAVYIKQVWPQVAKAQDPYKLLVLQFNSAPDSTMKRGYHYFPNTFKLIKGSGNNRIEMEWQRKSWRTWQLSKLCFYNPQPFDDTKRCASSSR